MIVFDDEENLKSNFTDVTLQFIQDMYGPRVKDLLLLPRTVVKNVDRVDTRT